MKTYDLIIIGGGPAGLAAAVASEAFCSSASIMDSVCIHLKKN